MLLLSEAKVKTVRSRSPLMRKEPRPVWAAAPLRSHQTPKSISLQNARSRGVFAERLSLSLSCLTQGVPTLL